MNIQAVFNNRIFWTLNINNRAMREEKYIDVWFLKFEFNVHASVHRSKMSWYLQFTCKWLNNITWVCVVGIWEVIALLYNFLYFWDYWYLKRNQLSRSAIWRRAQGSRVWRSKRKDPIPTCGDSNKPENSHLSHEPDLQGAHERRRGPDSKGLTGRGTYIKSPSLSCAAKQPATNHSGIKQHLVQESSGFTE